MPIDKPNELKNFRRIRVVRAGMAIAPVDEQTGQPLFGVVKCAVVQEKYGQLPRLLIEIVDFDVEEMSLGGPKVVASPGAAQDQ